MESYILMSTLYAYDLVSDKTCNDLHESLWIQRILSIKQRLLVLRSWINPFKTSERRQNTQEGIFNS